MATLTYLPSHSSPVERVMRSNDAKFGRGYVQRARLGINQSGRKWQLVFDGLSIAAAAPIFTFFETHSNGDPFDWTPPFGGAGRWTCTDYSQDYAGYNLRRITAALEEDFAP